MKLYAVIDTNVLISATLKWSSVPGNILEFVFRGVITPVLSEDIVKEYREVLMREKFHLDEVIVNDIISAIEDVGEYINPEHPGFLLPDPDDTVFYEVVMEKRKESDAYLVTGNIRHFPTKPFIVTPREMLDIVLEKLN